MLFTSRFAMSSLTWSKPQVSRLKGTGFETLILFWDKEAFYIFGFPNLG